jgi:outer membrane protein
MSLPRIIDLVIKSMGIRPGRATRLEAKVGAKPTLAVLDAESEAIAADAASIEAEGQRMVAAWQINALIGALAQ